ncbi:MAG: EAL domain-containing protein [Gammaproteobacteria bacterium]|nr:EAL domain-containing protein [Gammaproteobacteria bacterium]
MAIATMANTLVPRRDLSRQVKAELTNILFQNTRGMHLAGIAVAVLLVFMFRETALDPRIMAAWLIYMVVVECGRGLLGRRFRMLTAPFTDSGLWKRRFNIGNLLAALGWGLAGILLFPPGDVAHQMFLTIVIMGACAVAMPALSALIGGYLLFLFVASLPLTIRLVSELHEIQLTAALLSVVMAAILARMAIGMHQRLVEQLNVRFAYADLADELRTEMSDRQRAEEQLTQLANYDALTGLPNRTQFEQKLKHAIMRARGGDAQLAVLFVDLDRFKHINDSLGHQTGDEVLKRVAQRLRRCIGVHDMVARLSGDEFILIIEEVRDHEQIEVLAERILRTIAKPMLLNETELRVSCSVGITLLAAGSPDAKSLLSNADTALYRAKHRGRNRYQFFTPDMHDAVLQRVKREVELRKALPRGELTLHYQPLFDLLNGKLMGVEALLRWQSHEFGLVPPTEFIPLAEETGLIIPIGEWVLREACQQAVRWRQLHGGEFHMAVNLSVRQFTVPDLAGIVGRILGETGLPPTALLLEITESVALSNDEGNLDELRKLRGLGIRLALDDFGTGNSSLGYLRRFPIDVLKLDQSFVRDVATSHEDAAVARATIQLANSLGIRVVAEGVENEAQLKWLQLESCELIQGYLLSEPLDVRACEQLLLNHAQAVRPPSSDKMN